MNKLKVGWAHWFGGALCLSLLGAGVAGGVEPTALGLIKEGNRFVGEQSKDKVLDIHSDKSVASLTPNVWYVVYFDPDTPFKRVEVKFGAGQQMGVKREMHPFGGMGSLDKVMDPKKLKIDSDRALKTATAEPCSRNSPSRPHSSGCKTTGPCPCGRCGSGRLN